MIGFIGEKIKKGSALAYGLVIMTVVSIILVSILQFISSQVRLSIHSGNKEQSFQLAEAGVYFYRWYLAHETETLNAKQLNEFWASGNALGVGGVYEKEFPEGDPIGKYQIEVEAPEANSTIVTVESTGWTYKNPDMKRKVRVRFRKPSWSEYAVVTDSDIRFGEGTVVNGKIHSNGGIRFDGVAYNLITSHKDTYDDPDHSGGVEFGVHTHESPIDPLPPANAPVRNDVFVAGRQFPVPLISFTGFSEDNDFIKDEAKAGLSGDGCTNNGCYFDDSEYGREIILKSNGTFDVRIVASMDSYTHSVSLYRRYDRPNRTCSNRSDSRCVRNYQIPDGGIIFVENDVWVMGEVSNKKITIVASDNSIVNPASYGKNIYIGEDNLNYSSYDGNDIIGLVAQKNISVIFDCLSNLTIDAALLAQNGRVGRDYYPLNYKNSITVNGSIATKLRYGFAYTDGTGYQDRILHFDNNLLYYPPPYFPTGDAYAIDLWEEL